MSASCEQRLTRTTTELIGIQCAHLAITRPADTVLLAAIRNRGKLVGDRSHCKTKRDREQYGNKILLWSVWMRATAAQHSKTQLRHSPSASRRPP